MGQVRVARGYKLATVFKKKTFVNALGSYVMGRQKYCIIIIITITITITITIAIIIVVKSTHQELVVSVFYPEINCLAGIPPDQRFTCRHSLCTRMKSSC